MLNTCSGTSKANLVSVLEVAAYVFLLVLGAIALEMNYIGISTATDLATLMLIALLTLAWKRFDGGRHPCFLFLGMLLIFQAGRLLGHAMGILPDPFRIELQTAIPFDVSKTSAQLTICLILMSAVCIYAPCRWSFRPVRLNPGWEQRWRSAAYGLFLLTFPAVLYKNYQYLSFVRSHGGYLAIYTDSNAVLSTVGTLVRMISLIADNSFLVLFIIERRPRRLFWISLLFFTSSTLELLLGFRGKVFLLVLTLWYLHTLKTGKAFRVLPLVMSAIGVSLVAVLIANFRENQDIALLSPAGFISGQGVSMQVTELAIEFKRIFEPHAITYLWNELQAGFYPGAHFAPGQIFGNDLSIALNAKAYDMGFGTGSAYLAEAYLAGGTLFVGIASLLIGITLRILHSCGQEFLGASITATLLPAFIYMPRSGLVEPLSIGLKNLLSLGLVVFLLWASAGVRSRRNWSAFIG